MYDLYSKFDIDEHVKKYPYYTEVVIFPDGTIEYAVPSHQEKLIKICVDKLGVSRQKLCDLCPPEYHFDFVQWLCNTSGCMSVWYDFSIRPDQGLTDSQLKSVRTPP